MDWHVIFGLEQEGGSLIAPMALTHPLHPNDNRSRNKRRNLWVGRCVSSWLHWFPSRSFVLIYMYIYMYVHSLYKFCYRSYIQRECHSVLAKLYPITFYGIVFLGSARSWAGCHFLFSLVSWINHLPPACWSTFWKSNFKQQLGCRFDIMDNESYFFVFWHMQIYMSWYIRSFFAFTFLNIIYFFKSSCTNIFHRRSLYTFYWRRCWISGQSMLGEVHHCDESWVQHVWIGRHRWGRGLCCL